MRQNDWHYIHVVLQYELSDQQLFNFTALNTHIFKEEEFEGKITYMDRELASLKWISEPVKKKGRWELRHSDVGVRRI